MQMTCVLMSVPRLGMPDSGAPPREDRELELPDETKVIVVLCSDFRTG